MCSSQAVITTYGQSHKRAELADMCCFYLGEGRTDSSLHSANQSMCCLEQIPLMSWLQFSWIRKTWYYAVSVVSSSCGLLWPADFFPSWVYGNTYLRLPEDCIIEIHPPTCSPTYTHRYLWQISWGMVNRPKTHSRTKNYQKGMCVDHKPASPWSVKILRAR